MNHIKQFKFQGYHIIELRNGNATCSTRSVPVVIVNAILFMAENNVQRLVVDGAPIERVM